MDYLPVFLRLHAQPVVVVGGGQVALRKALWLRRAGALVTVVAPHLHPELGQRVARGELTHIAAGFCSAQLAHAVAVVAATDDRMVNAAVAAAARERRVPVNVVDDAELSSFIFPAIIDRSPIVVAVSSAGHSPVLARRVREQIEALLPERLGALARFMGARRSARWHREPAARSGSASPPVPSPRTCWPEMSRGPIAPWRASCSPPDSAHRRPQSASRSARCTSSAPAPAIRICSRCGRCSCCSAPT
jgi:uroporphyrin-III C-methyltransferase/precorrin-2 dehydrogenase/sirohydrochlorin ferrochelatase